MGGGGPVTERSTASMAATQGANVPRAGMVATVRNRRGVVSSVAPFDTPEGRLHLVDVEYHDSEAPLAESLLWEREVGTRLLEPTAAPDVAADDPMPHDDLAALVRACRWTARTPFLDPDATGPVDRLPISSPFHGAVQIEDFQLVPLLKALRMPRVSLLLADDVGLGKTIEAGLILSELLLRRRVRRVLVLTPASLRQQWKEELWSKFSLDFEVVDLQATERLRRQLGLDANPWRSFSRVIASYHYLKQADVLEQFRAASRLEAGGARLPWDLLIVDEVHNLAPASFGEESDVCRMLRQVAPLCEHRLFLTATPHNGYTRSFTGLLEVLDPVRFSQTDELGDAERKRVEEVLVRRLKREINARSASPRFCERLPPEALLLDLDPAERELSAAFSAFRKKVQAITGRAAHSRHLAGSFAVEILGKRLLSGPFTFAESWQRTAAGFAETVAATDSEVLASRRALADETADDREAESRGRAAAAAVGAWLKPLAPQLAAEIAALDAALARLGLAPDGFSLDRNPGADSRYARLRQLIGARLRQGGSWRDEERLVLFTEYKTTLDYLLRRLRADFGDPLRMLCLYGGMGEAGDTGRNFDLGREEIKAAFNDPDHHVRVLVATDAASEGLNLQETARYLLHWDIPWNPSRLEQRNGRLDRHGQARDVQVWHFASNDDDDLRFLAHVVRKVDAIREDLGATGEVFDEATRRRLIEGENLASVQADLDARLAAAQSRVEIPRDACATPAELGGRADLAADLEAIASELDFDPEALHRTLDTAMAIGVGRPRLSDPDATGRSRFVQPVPPSWMPVVDDTVRLPGERGVLGALPALAFDPQTLVVSAGGRPVFRPRRDTLLVHLGHPLLQRALVSLSRLRFPGGSERGASRWTVRRGGVPAGCEALVVLHLEELAVNELRESFHHWVRTVRLPVAGGAVGDPLPHVPARALRQPAGTVAPGDAGLARELWLDLERDLRKWLSGRARVLGESLRAQLAADLERAAAHESKRFQIREKEVSTRIADNTMKKLERELEALRVARRQGVLFAEQAAELDRDLAEREAEVERRRRHYEEVRAQLQRERERVLRHLLPARFTLRGEPQVFPLAVEIVLPGGAA